MDMKRLGLIVGILICAFATRYSEGSRRLAGTFSGNSVDWESPEIDEHTADQVWMNCRQELIDIKDSFRDFTNTKSSSVPLTRRNVHKTLSTFPPQVNQYLFACLHTKTLSFGSPRESEKPRNLFLKYLDLLFSPKRNHVNLSRKKIPANHAPSPAPYLAPVPAPAPVQYPVPSPAPVEALAPSIPPDVAILPPAPSKSIHSTPWLSVAHKIPAKNDKNGDEEKKRTIINIAAATFGVFFLASILICCFCKRAKNKIDPQDGVKDERPLLSLSDFSAGSSQKSHSLGDSSNKDFSINSGKNPSLTNNLSIASDTPSDESVSGAVNGSTGLPPLKPPPGRTAPTPPPPGPPPPPPAKPGPRPPPPPKGGRPPPAPPAAKPPHSRVDSTSSEGNDGDPDAPKAKLKPFFWDKVAASPDHTMVWHEISAGSFQFNEETMESLFGYAQERNKNNRKTDSTSSLEGFPQYIQIIDPRKAQNLSILLRALNVTTDEVCDALRDGTKLPTELVQTLLKMAPSADEELKLRLYSGDLGQLGPAERFLKVLVEIPFAFKRLESLLFMNSLQEEVTHVQESFATIEVACNKLRNSRLFLKLLEAVLKTGNRMNDGTYRGGAQAFKLDTLLKLSDVKGTDGKTTLLHFVVQEIIRSEGLKAARAAQSQQHDLVGDYRSLGLQVVLGVSTELGDVKKAAFIDMDGLTSTVSNLVTNLLKTRNFLNFEMQNLDEESEFCGKISTLVEETENDVNMLRNEDERIKALVKSTTDYFHGQAGKDEGLRLFVIVRDFLVILDKACKDVRDDTEKKTKMGLRKEVLLGLPENMDAKQNQVADNHRRLFPAIKDRRMGSSSSDDDDDSSSSSSP